MVTPDYLPDPQVRAYFLPNNYRTIMVGHTFSKLYAIALHRKLSHFLEQRQLRAKGQARFCPDHQTIYHILTFVQCSRRLGIDPLKCIVVL